MRRLPYLWVLGVAVVVIAVLFALSQRVATEIGTALHRLSLNE